MPLRLIELTLPEDRVAELSGLLEDQPVVQTWTTPAATGIAIANVLLDARHVEGVFDRLVERYGSVDGFRVIALAIEATLPVVDEEEEEADDESADGKSESARDRISREELYEDLAQATRVTPVYLVMVALSTLVAAVGLIRGDVAIIIGAMVIAPLLGPNVALSLAFTLGDSALAKRSLTANGAGVALAAALALLLGAVLRVDPNALPPEMAARTSANLGDVVLALAAGAAGSLAFTTGVPAVVVGVMVAVALLPPLVVAGLLVGAGDASGAAGALLLLITNVTCVNLAAVMTFLIQKVRPRTFWEAERARVATRVAVTTWIVLLAILVAVMIIQRFTGV